MSYDIESLVNHFSLYSSFIPETLIALVFCNIGMLLSILQRRNFEDAQDTQSAAFAATLTILATAGSIALVFWKYVIVYAFFPIECLILPPTAFYSSKLVKILPAKIATTTMIVAVVFVFALLAPTRFIQAQLQFYLDDSARN